MPPQQQATTLPEQPVMPPVPSSPSGHKTLYIILGALVIVIIAIILVWKLVLTQPVAAPVVTPIAPVAAKVYTAEELNKLIPVTAEEYSRLLKDFKPEFSLDNDKLEVVLSPVPNLINPAPMESNVLLVATSATDWAGKNYGQDSSLTDENNVWSRADVSVLGDLHLKGENTFFLHQIKDLESTQVASVSGKLILNLPIGIQELVLRPTDVGKAKEANGISVNLVSLQIDPTDKSKVQIKYVLTGDENKIVDQGLVNGNTPVGHFSSRMGDSEIEETYNLSADETISNLGFKFYIASSWLRQEYPFTVNNSQPKPSSTSSNTSSANTEKDQIIAAILNRQTVFASKDVAKIKAFFAKTVPADQLAELNKASDEEVLGMAGMMSAFAVTGAQLKAPTTVWQISASEAKATIVEGNGKTSVNAVKSNGAWY